MRHSSICLWTKWQFLLWQTHFLKCVPGLQIPPGWVFLAKGTNLLNSVIATGQELSATLPLLFKIIVQSLSHIQLFVTLWTAARQASLSLTISCSLLKFMSIELVMPSNQSFSATNSSFCLQSFPASESFPVRWLFGSGGQSIGASALALVLSMNIQVWFPLEFTGLISLQVQGALKNLLQHHNLKASVLWCSTFFYNPTLTFIYDYQKSHSFDFMGLCLQTDVSAS